jgi:hypothetical protein
MNTLVLGQLANYEGGGKGCAKSILLGALGGGVSGALAGSELIAFGPQAGAAGTVLGASYGIVSGALLAYASC